MRKTLLSLFVLLLPSVAFAASDSLAVIVRAEKALVQINERGADSRLQKFFSGLGAGKELLLLSPDGALKIDCGRNEAAATCVLRFLPSQRVKLAPKMLVASYSFAELGLNPPLASFSFSFESSNGDKLTLTSDGGALLVRGTKR